MLEIQAYRIFSWISEFAKVVPFKACACSSDIESINKYSPSYILFECKLQIQSVLGKAVTNLVHVNLNCDWTAGVKTATTKLCTIFNKFL